MKVCEISVNVVFGRIRIKSSELVKIKLYFLVIFPFSLSND